MHTSALSGGAAGSADSAQGAIESLSSRIAGPQRAQAR
ncbi:hypothetical protein MMEU_5322 [Mycobacterium marinum str. Europe]|nr:hypothetical protein MMEU_5322 [Mycobacterium marinum str. Europe]